MDHAPPTPYAALNAVLSHFVSRVRDLLADNFVGANLQGSFALGDFDAHSDVDFLIATRDDIADAQVPALNALHAGMHDFPSPWGHRLEGSYVPAAILRQRGEAEPAALWFLDHGARQLVRSTHDDTCVVRWVTREKGIVLAGPAPRALIDEVPAEALRHEMRANLRDWPTTWFPDPDAIKALWLQASIVVAYCRVLHTLATGTVTSKPAAAAWAMRTLDRRWRPLIAASLRARPSQSLGPADPQAVAETMAFVAQAAYPAQLALSIRPMAATDLEAIVRLAVAAWAPVFRSFEQVLGSGIYRHVYPDWRRQQADWVTAVCIDAAKFTVWVAEIDGEVAGFIACNIESTARIGTVQLLAVDPGRQNRGVGTALNRFALDRMREHGMVVATVATGGDPGHAPARRAYVKAGYGALPLVRYYQRL